MIGTDQLYFSPWKAQNILILKLDSSCCSSLVQASFLVTRYKKTVPFTAPIPGLCSEGEQLSKSGGKVDDSKRIGLIERWIRWEAEAKSIIFSLIHYPECKRQTLDNRWGSGHTHAFMWAYTHVHTHAQTSQMHRPHSYRQVKATSVCLDRWQGLWRSVWNTLWSWDTHTHIHTKHVERTARLRDKYGEEEIVLVHFFLFTRVCLSPLLFIFMCFFSVCKHSQS